MRLRDLKAELQRVRPFDVKRQKYDLEQYPTGAEIAAHLVFTAATVHGDIEDCVVADLGCGTAMLGIGAALMGASTVLGMDADMDALEIAQQNVCQLDVAHICDFAICDVGFLPTRPGLPIVDTVIMNPPFGTRSKGADVAFLEAAIALRPHAIYSLHKSSTRDYLLRRARDDWGVQAEVIAELRFDIPKMYKFHKSKSRDIEVDFIRLELPEELRDSPCQPSAGEERAESPEFLSTNSPSAHSPAPLPPPPPSPPAAGAAAGTEAAGAGGGAAAAAAAAAEEEGTPS